MSRDALSPQQFPPSVPTRSLYKGVEPEVKHAHKMEGEEAAWHVGQIERLIESMHKHGYRPELALDDPIVAFKHDKGIGVSEGRHRVVAAHHAGIEELPVEWEDDR